MKLKVAQVIGLNTDQKAAQVISSLRDGGENGFFAVLDLTCDDAFTKGRQILSELSDFYFDFEGSSSEKLNATFEEARLKFKEEEFSMLVCSLSGKILYLIGKGEVEVYLKRDDKLSTLLSVGVPSQLISGFLQERDKLLLSTKSLISFLGEDLEKSFSLSIDAFEGELSDRIGASNLENLSLASLMIETDRVVENQPEEVLAADAITSESAPVFDSSKVRVSEFLNGLKSLFKNYFPKSNRGRLILAGILIIIIVLGVGFKIKSSRDAAKRAEFNQLLQGAKDDFEGAKGLATLTPAEAKTKLDSAKDKLSKALSLDPKDTGAQDLKKQIDDQSSSILQQSSVSEFPLFLDMDLVKKNFRATQISLSDGKLLLLDPTVGTLVSVNIFKKSNQILAGSEQLGDGKLSSINGALTFVYSKDKGVLRVDVTNQKTTTVSKIDKDWGEIKDIYGFASNVYLLDSTKNMIWKYLPTSGGYSDKREYLTKGTKVDFSNSLRMQIESSVYVLKRGGEILRFTKGDKDNFGLAGLDKGVKDPKSIFVSSDTDNFYVLDSGNSRLLILTKTGSYKGQIQGTEFGNASDLVVDEKSKKVYLLDGSKIYTADLK